MRDLALRPTSALAAAIRARESGCRELLEHYLTRVERHMPAFNAIVVTDLGRARRCADEANTALACNEKWGALL